VNRRRIARIALVALIAGAQLVVPALALRRVRPAALGWHMFVTTADQPEITLVLDDGNEKAADIDDYVVRYRPELDFPRRLTPELCDRNPHLVAVRYERHDRRTAVVTC
jgi:hypothetical protein